MKQMEEMEHCSNAYYCVASGERCMMCMIPQPWESAHMLNLRMFTESSSTVVLNAVKTYDRATL